jgi:hypothetical protein
VKDETETYGEDDQICPFPLTGAKSKPPWCLVNAPGFA